MIDFTMVHMAQAHNMLVDMVGSDVYIGYSVIGIAESEPRWSIRKINTTNPISKTHAGGTPNFDKVWTDRASYSYS